MKQLLTGTFFGPLETVELQPDTQVGLVVTVKVVPQDRQKSFLRTARALKLKGPKDFSSLLDDYLYLKESLNNK